ncbi:DUF4834 family protein [Flavobacteriaceae bacterium TP-CH-4]|uniref:DUF4834 family protein n=1 Tax=Pelagihabitans pacificus TaxID=2696054 RepID=A0A967ART9_9FLAO|nr:DUF4834 family protein [Pelagihabitans pacificus]NHF59196.1 DUF4834 family protein [Pelagihabitans pacificus]
MAFLKTLLIILLVYYLFKILVRMFAPKIFGYAAKKTEEHFRERFGEFADFNSANGEQQGDIIIEKKKTRKKDSSQDVGEYIDFEEID